MTFSVIPMAMPSQTFLGNGSAHKITERIPNGGITQQQRQLVTVTLSESIEMLQNFCKENSVLLPTVFKAAWALVLGRYLGSEEVKFTSIVEDDVVRSVAPCQFLVDETASILKVLNNIELDVGAHNSQETSNEPGQHAKADERPLSNSHLHFQATQPEVLLASMIKNNETTENVILFVKISGNKLNIALNYSTFSLPKEQAINIGATVTKALSLIIQNPQQTIGELELISDRDLATIWDWNKAQPHVVDECVYDVIKRQVECQPDALAICAWDGSMTYRQLDDLSTRLAHHLVGLGVGPEIVVPLCFEKSAWAIVAFLAVVKAGGAVVFIDPSHPAGRREEVIGQIAATMVVTSPAQVEQWAEWELEVVVVEQAFVEGLSPQTEYPATKVHPKNVLYIIFTSGSTGKPKGCVVEHSSFCSGAVAQAEAANMTSSSRVLQLASYSFDVSLLEILTALMHGACICTPSEASMREGIASLVNKFEVTWAFLTPSLVKVVAPSDVPGLKTLILGGEALSKTDIETWADHLQLGNGYGPSECSVAAAGNPNLTSASNPANIGRAVGGLCWIVDAEDHNKLVPVGAVGELLIEGPIVARGYLNAPEKTAEVFVTGPAWGPNTATQVPRRLYKTGDLARYNPDGTIHFIGRKDTQVKLRGLRIELGEIEHHISVHRHAQHAIVVLPKSGHCKERLVVALSLKEFLPATSGNSEIRLISEVSQSSASQQVAEIREHLSGLVPHYMVPETWVIVESIPLMLSGKMARAPVLKWITDMDDETYHRIVGVESQDEENMEMTEHETQLRLVYSDVLNLPVNRIPLDRSFLSLGGDSISAMQVMSRCRARGMAVTVKDIIRQKSISELALCVAHAAESRFNMEESFDTPFDLSPVQQMYVATTPLDAEKSSSPHYNQSFFLSLTRETPVEELVKAFQTVVSQHSMLRARFVKAESGKWQQFVMKKVEGSYNFSVHDLAASENTTPIIAAAQASLDLVHGPVFAVHLFNIENKGQFLFLVAHHAVIDLVSWRVILRDLEDAITTGQVTTKKPLPYQTWLQLQAENVREYGSPRDVLPFEVTPPDIEYWGMAGQPNSIADTREDIVKLDLESTARLMGTLCHAALRTEPIDLLMSVLMHSFIQTFTDRATPTIFRESHGREPWTDEIDISETVGWFTTMFPLCIDAGPADDIVEFTRRVKDNRRVIPDNGRPYFASRFLNEEGIKAFAHHSQVEICFDYLGLYQQLEKPDALLRQEPRIISEETSDIGPGVQRFALMEITAEMISGQMQFSIVYNRKMKNQSKIQEWISDIPRSFIASIDRLSKIGPQYTLSDFPMLAMSYDGLGKLLDETLPQMGILAEEVQDIYPCSPMQQGLLISQNKASGFYEYSHTLEIVSRSANPVDVDRLKSAWQKVVQRHSVLRTIFFPSVGTHGVYDQLVLKKSAGRISSFKCESDEAGEIFKNQAPISFNDIEPPNRLTVCETSGGQVFCKLEFNHAIIDGGSMPIILQDFVLAYDDKIPDRPGPLFGDYISYLVSLPREAGVNYWKEYLKDMVPTYFPVLEGSDKDPQLKEMEVKINATTVALQEFCHENNLTLSNIFQAAWGLVLRAHTGLNDVCFGYLSSGREVPVSGIESAVGPFITMLVSRLVLNGETSISEVLQNVQEDFLLSIQHQHCSLADIQHALELSGQPLFNTVMSFQKAEDEAAADESGISVIGLAAHDPTEYSVSVDVMVSDVNVVTTLGYWTSSISNEQAQNLGSLLSRAIDCILENVNGAINDIDLVGEDHMTQIMNWNSELPPAYFHCIHDLFQEQVLAQPDAPAMCSFDGDFTYAELDILSTKLAHHLVGLGVGPEVLVPFCFQKSAWTTVTVIAILKAGGACVPLDPAHPLNRLKTIINITGAKLVIVAPQNAHLFEGIVETIVSVDPIFVAALPTMAGKPCTTVRPDNAAYVIFSSGTTGVPKGIVLEHYSIATFAQGQKLMMGTGPGKRVLQFASYAFDVSVSDILVTLMLGACICNISDHDRMNNLSKAIRAVKPTIADLTSTVASLLRPADIPSLKVLQLGGEAMTKEVVDIWANKIDLLANVYGPAECTVSISYKCGILDDSDVANIGHVVAGLGWVVELNNHDKLAPLGCVGELIVEGPLLSRGYLKDPEKTEKAFIKDPVWSRRTSRRNRRFYKTGDLVRYNSDGSLHLVGRADTQVKLHGQRLELTDIEAHIVGHLPSLRQVTAEAIRPRGSTRKCLAVFFVADSPDSTESHNSSEDLTVSLSPELRDDLQELHKFLAASLPSYIVPSMYISMRRMPLTSSGKLSRAALGEIAAGLSEEQQVEYSLEDKVKQLPSTEMEKMLQLLWSDVLGISPDLIGANDSFFRLGGDSVVAMRLVAAARASNVLISVANIFQNPELCNMALVVESPKAIAAATANLGPFSLLEDSSLAEIIEQSSSQCKIEKELIEDIYPCTPLQEGLMAISTRQQGAYVARMVFKLPPTLNLDRFRDAWREIVALEPILRTRIVHTNAGSLQVVLRNEEPWQMGLTLEAYLEKYSKAPIEYGGLLHRLAIIEEIQGASYFVWMVHHALYDGWSQDLLFERVKLLYMGESVPKTPSYNQFIQFLANTDQDASDAFWRSQLLREEAPTSFPLLPSPSYKPRPDQVQTLSIELSRQKVSTITSATIMKAAWAMVVSRYSNSDDIIFALTLSGRTAPVAGIMEMTGPTITTVPLRIQLPRDQTTVYEYLEAIQNQSTEMMPYEHAGLQNLRRLCLGADTKYELDLKHLFVFQPSSEDDDTFLDLELMPTDEADFNTYALVIQCSYENGKVTIEARYDGMVIETEQMRRMLFQFEHVIRQLNDESRSIRVDDVELFSPQDLQQLQIWNNQKHESMDICIHEVIQKQVLSRPIDALAVCSWDGELTYRELDSLSSRLASYLIDLGVGPEIMVPICFDKSAWTIVAMIAVLKAGGAYVSLSPAHPLTRLRGIVDDIDASIILVAPQHAALFESVLPTIVVVDPSWLNTLPAAITTASSRGPPDSPAFVVFTSGSTGKPKGVVLEHRSMVTMAHAEGPTMQFDSNTRVLHFAASTFDVSNSEVLTTLMFGGCVCVPSEAERMNDLVGVINRWKVNWLFLTPAMADIMDPSAVPTLKTLALGGEAIRQDLLERWADKVHLINSYGPSETTIWTSNSHLRSETTPANIGRGYGAHTWVTEISNHNRLAPIGCIGELLVEGPILARGYIKDPERTAISFIVDPIWARNSQAGPRRIYKTGDLVRYNSDGTLDYIGRKDTQVKLRGQRIELGEIEYHIKQSFLDAQQVVADVILQEGRADDKILAAFLELGPADIDMDDDSDSVLEPMSQQLQSKMLQLQLSLMESLPPYMIPSLFIILKRLPTTTSGKLDRKEMRNLASKLSKAQLAPYSLANLEKRAPSTPMEQKLQGLWSKLLHIESSSIGADDSFFQSGGDSIIAMRLAAVARTENLSITVADIFRYPKLSEMAKAVQNVTFTPATQLKPFCLLKQEHSSIDIIERAASLCNVETEAIEDIYPCTPLQEALVDISIRNKGTYIAQNVFRLPEALDLVRFKETWQKLADMHSILRTRVIEMALQVVVREKITWQTASTLDLYLQDDLAMGIELGGPLCRYAIVEGHFIWTAHHAVYDAWSIQSLFEQLENLYNGVDITEPVPYNNFIQHLANVDQEASDAFWEGQLSGDKPTSFPEVHSLVYQPHPDEAYTHTVSISHDPKAGILMSTILQAAWAMTVARYSDSTDVAFAMAVSGRNVHMDGIATVMGPTITTVPVRMRLDPEQVVANYLKGAQNQITEMIPFAHVGLQNIRGLKNAVDLKHLFVIQSSTDEGTTDVLGMKSVPMELMGFDSYGLVVECVQGAGKIDVEVRYDGAIISRDRIQRMLYLFEHLIRQFNDQESHSTALKDISVFSVQDSEQVAAWNIKQPAVSNECMHSLVAAQVSARSYAPAILAWDGNFTYAELDSRSTQLAHHLISVGVKPEVMVPLCYDKSGWAIIAMLAILKAGGACVALNPEHPPERLQRIVNDVKATVIVAQQHHAHLFQGIDADIVSPDKSLLKKYSKTGTFTMAQPENPAFVVFTSGSTGAPKGIILEHRALCTSAHAHGKAMRLGVDSRVLQFAAYTFDVSIGEIFTTLIHGGCICVPSEEERMNDLAAFINRMSVNWAYLTPTVAALLHPADVPTLKTLSLGGEALTKENVAVWADKVYLINIYGPAETSIWSTALCGLKPETPPSNLGYGVGASMWITEVSNHNHLCPIGCVGELLIEGAILARGYVGLEEKTRESFIMNPTWAKGHGDRRFYKTGDLVRYNADGTIDYVSRKDTQFKLHGQRIEASEIEHHLSTDSHVRHSMVLLPKAKSGQQRLTAILSLESIAVPASKGKPQLVQNEAAEMEIFSIRKQLSEKVPGYMVPAIWLVVEDISMTVSGKMNRLEMTKWVEQMDEDVYATAMDIEKLDGSEIPATDMEEKIQKILSHVLNMPIIRLNKSFMSLGGDSITAMQMRTKCRAEGISVSIQDILRSKTISQIALAAKSISESSVSHIEVLDTPFDLSPVQQMYFDIESKNSTSHHFYQSFLLRVTRKIGALQMARAIETVVGQHSMLRARFTQGEDGQWMQRIIGDVADSYRFKMHEFTKRAQAMSLISSSQNSLDIVNGPVFVAELFNISDDDSGDNSYQLLFVRAHHLVIDLVSWRIILHDLEEVLESGRLSVQKPLSFQGWCGMLAEHTKQMVPQETLPIHISPADFDYWGMANQPNIFEDQLETTFSLDREMTNKLFGVSNEALRTEPVDIILAALIYSFNQVFNDRQTPTIFSEGHGRESWDPEIDVAGIVGWFTTMNPLHVPVTNGQGILATLEHTKDLRRKVPSSGFSYFCSRFLSPEGRKAFGDHNQMEVIFNYQGRYQQLERDTALLRPEDLAEMEGPKDQGPDMERFSLFEISVAVVKGETEVCFTYNRHMQHLDFIERWILECKESLKKITAQLATMEVKITLSDFPLLSLDDNQLQKFEANLSGLGINPSHVQDAYPTSPMQESMLLAQQRKPGVYEVQNIYDVLPGSEGGIVDTSRLVDAWQKVVDRHVSLRTLFVPSVSRKGGFDQIVLDRYCAMTEYIECSDDNLSKAIHDQQSIDYQEPRPHHRLSIFRSGSKVACKLEISHALSDGISIRLLIRDLGIAYESKAQLHPGPLYHDYISFLQQQSSSQANDYWRSYLRTVKQCHFPHSEGNLSRVKEQRTLRVNLNEDFTQIQAFCKHHGFTVANVFQATWGLVLRHYTGRDDASYGYLTSGRDIPIAGVSDLVGTLIHMLVYRQDITETTMVSELLERTKEDFLQSLPYQYGLIEALGAQAEGSEQLLFNTIMSLQYSGGLGETADAADMPLVRFENTGGQDPNQYDMSIAVDVGNTSADISLAYWTTVTTDEQACEIGHTFAKTLSMILANPGAMIVDLDFS